MYKKEINKEDAKELAQKDPYKFIILSLDFDYPEFTETAIENLATQNPHIFYSTGRGYDNKYPQFCRAAAESFLDKTRFQYTDFKFFFYRLKLHKKFPELVLKIG